jgi:acetyltransferase-like isoleucine patch superfamily enzyme
VFDDGCVIPEKSLVRIGDDAVLNAGSVIQCHSLEDGYFQSGYTSIGIAATVGIKSFVHYGVTIGDGAVLDADAFLLKVKRSPRMGAGAATRRALGQVRSCGSLSNAFTADRSPISPTNVVCRHVASMSMPGNSV